MVDQLRRLRENIYTSQLSRLIEIGKVAPIAPGSVNQL